MDNISYVLLICILLYAITPGSGVSQRWTNYHTRIFRYDTGIKSDVQSSNWQIHFESEENEPLLPRPTFSTFTYPPKPDRYSPSIKPVVASLKPKVFIKKTIVSSQSDMKYPAVVVTTSSATQPTKERQTSTTKMAPTTTSRRQYYSSTSTTNAPQEDNGSDETILEGQFYVPFRKMKDTYDRRNSAPINAMKRRKIMMH